MQALCYALRDGEVTNRLQIQQVTDDHTLRLPKHRIQRGEYEAAAEAAHKTFQANPYWSYAHFLLAATHVKLGRLNAARSAAERVLELEPGYTISGTCVAFDIHPALAEPLSEALSLVGLPR